ncbi:hypothetical protein GTQ99_00535 [Kineococcus sp. T13]|uniref:hypothetical protein n=1 Tax=Kineococcus vitellinus TaxID=2696565 RepID=UPI001412EAAC|nr:hypothetical protein [Kineococcus vitellinus]NAZ73918.1 hypothetical protein [Kineococcus vitellinus]
MTDDSRPKGVVRSTYGNSDCPACGGRIHMGQEIKRKKVNDEWLWCHFRTNECRTKEEAQRQALENIAERKRQLQQMQEADKGAGAP